MGKWNEVFAAAIEQAQAFGEAVQHEALVREELLDLEVDFGNHKVALIEQMINENDGQIPGKNEQARTMAVDSLLLHDERYQALQSLAIDLRGELAMTGARASGHSRLLNVYQAALNNWRYEEDGAVVDGRDEEALSPEDMAIVLGNQS